MLCKISEEQRFMFRAARPDGFRTVAGDFTVRRTRVFQTFRRCLRQKKKRKSIPFGLTLIATQLSLVYHFKS